MRRSLLFAISALFVAQASAQPVAVELVRAGEAFTERNIKISDGGDPSSKALLLGMAAKRTIYPGQAITPGNIKPADIIRRNQIVTVKYIREGLEITTTARAMDSAGAQASVSVLNLQSKQIVSGIVQNEGWVLVQ
ncbi:MAG: flagellar basal body P-ring formation chaperone FlgA [Pseudomonadota bacterium]